MSLITLELTSSLEKIFPDKRPEKTPTDVEISALLGETVSFQIAYYYDGKDNKLFHVSVESPVEHLISIREVVLVPSAFTSYREADEGYLRTAPGLFPDLLRTLEDGKVKFITGQWNSVWIDIETTKDCVAGRHPVRIVFTSEDGLESQEISTEVKIIKATLSELPIHHTEWFHGDCLSDYYGVDACSDEHFRIMENFIETAVKRDINMILVPQFTPPLDTAVGGERTTIQLVDIRFDHGIYRFEFEKLKRFIDICRKQGIKFLEMSHLFTQWGAKAAPKIMATVNGQYQRIFGWDTPAVGGEYEKFLQCYLPQLTEKLRSWGVENITYFHISDEPDIKDIECYRQARELVKPYLKDFQILDALSDYEFYEMGLVDNVACATDQIEPFLQKRTPKLWSYYCTAQHLKVSNRFMSMASYRNRVYGIQAYLSGVIGILHWGYNFYYTQNSLQRINPYEVTDCGRSFPSGDAFLVYPGIEKRPEESIRLMVLYEAMTDLRAFKLLETITDKEYVQGIILNSLKEPITFTDYPHDPTYYLRLRQTINTEIEKRI